MDYKKRLPALKIGTGITLGLITLILSITAPLTTMVPLAATWLATVTYLWRKRTKIEYFICATAGAWIGAWGYLTDVPVWYKYPLIITAGLLVIYAIEYIQTRIRKTVIIIQ